MTAVEVLRVSAIVGGVLLAVLAAVVVGMYLWVWARSEAGHKGLLPGHVWAVATSYLLYVTAGVVELWTSLDQQPSWRTPVYLTATLIGLLALTQLLAYEVGRVRRGPRRH